VSSPDPTAVLDDLEWRGLIAQSTDLGALSEQLAAGPVGVYFGCDPTAPSLHVGNLVGLLLLRRFQLAGHRAVPLAGGATGLIGDPSGRSSERQLLDSDTIRERVALIRSQMERFLDLDGERGLLVDNLEWTAQLSAIDFLRDVGKHFSVNVMLQRESVSARLAGGGLSYTEFSYSLLQANDYLELYRRHDVRLQIGGSDQWGNIVAGVDLVRRVEGAAVHALTFPLLTDSSGAKFGKSTGGGSLWLDREMTSPYALYQYFLATDDRDAGAYLRALTFVPRDEVEELDRATAERPAARAAQRRLARELVTLVHGEGEVARVEAASAALFGAGALEDLDEPTLAAALAEAPSVQVTGDVPAYVDLLAQGLSLSKSDARRAVREGGAYLNNAKVSDEAAVPGESDWLHGRFLVLRRGKRSVTVVERAR